ncbi:cation diffusion facilitator family transporter [Spirulina subsalsa FACHB-351]|uniref:Cation diffusion facilitator family transporter n=1 Tax=Spirulina subsalsa FACHB-351 TaxID=234711 RepID=A0ABT3L1W8_9CYAN|nr:cation diffusion facilitator family transporter [Spirulina subsalsa]MCW6035479.1 cation diffusion facilitator family transporter [Spirulina subsalsa FACHB-351]
MSDCGCHIEAENKQERKTLWVLLLINGSLFVIEVFTGIFAESTALIADSLDMLADMTVYALSLYAVGKSRQHKNRAASWSGVFQITLAVLVLVDVWQRFITGSSPESVWMMGIAGLALLGNSYCLYLISKHRQGEIHMRASWIFTQNDVIANVGVIVAGLLVAVLDSRFPDLIVGLIISLIVLRGGVTIWHEARVNGKQ